MLIFTNSFSKVGENQFYDTVRYRYTLIKQLDALITDEEKAMFLKFEAIEISRHY